MDRIEVVETKKNKPCALYNGYEYRIHRRNMNGTINWLCRYEKNLNCKGRILTKDCEIVRISSHVCRPDTAATEVHMAIYKAKKRAREDEESIRTIYNQEVREIMNKGYDLVTEVPLYSSAKHTLHRIRRKAQGVTQDPKSKSEIVLSEELLAMHGGKETFLLADDREEDRIILFGSSSGKKAMTENSTFFMDGTFKSCAKQYAQLYTIHVDLGGKKEEINVIPVVYALLPDKKKETYGRVFKSLKKIVPSWKPEQVTMDFELSAINALTSAFPDVSVHGCNYHFNQALWRKVQNIGLTQDYINNESIRLHVRMCAALAYLPPEDLDEGWLKIQENTPINEKLQIFYDYFVDTWLENDAIPTTMWNCFNLRHRTNNVVEGWNYKINSIMKTPHPNIYSLVRELKKDAEYNDFMYNRIYLNMEGKRRKKKYLEIDERIEKTLLTYRVDHDIEKCLKKLAYIQKLQ